MKKNTNSSYTSILKSTTLFGGVQVITTLISILRAKIIATFIGAAGMGIVGLLNNTINLLNLIAGLSLDRTAVRNISAVSAEDDFEEIFKVITIARRLVFFTGMIAAILMFTFAQLLSNVTFGNDTFEYAFKWISVSLIFTQINQTEIAIFRGLRKLKFMSYCSVWGSISGLITSLPLYYFFGKDGIVAGIIISSIVAFLISRRFAGKLNVETRKVSWNHFRITSIEMLKMGFVLTISSLIVIGTSFVINIFIRRLGDLNDVGYFSAGFTIVNSYFGLIFSSLTMDYYPRLAAIAKDKIESIKLMNEQSEITFLIISPVLACFLVFSDVIIQVLYSNEFLLIEKMMHWAALGVFFKAASWALGVIFISKGDTRFILLTELLSNLILGLFSYWGYIKIGLEGLGVAFLISFVVMFCATYIIVNREYNFKYEKNTVIIFIFQFIIGILATIASESLTGMSRYLWGSFIFLLSFSFSVYKIKRLIDFNSLKFNWNNQNAGSI